MSHLKLILDGIKQGDKNGGPTELAKILSDSLLACEGFDKKDLISRYLHWWKTDAFDTGPSFAMVFEKVSNGAENIMQGDGLTSDQAAVPAKPKFIPKHLRMKQKQEAEELEKKKQEDKIKEIQHKNRQYEQGLLTANKK